MHIKISELLLVSLTLSLPVGTLARALPDPTSLVVRSFEASDILQTGHILKRVDFEPEPEGSEGPEGSGSDGQEPDPTDPSGSHGSNPQDVPDPANVAGAIPESAPAASAPQDSILGKSLTEAQALERGTNIDTALHNIPADAVDKVVPDMSHYNLVSEPAMDTDDSEALVQLLSLGKSKLGDGANFQRLKVQSKADEPEGASSAGEGLGVVELDAAPEEGLLIIPFMDKELDGNPAATQNFVSDLLRAAWGHVAGDQSGSLRVVMQKDISNTATKAMIHSLDVEAGVVQQFVRGTTGFKTLMGTDSAMVSNRMFLDYPTYFGHRTVSSIKVYWKGDSEDGSESSEEEDIDGYHMWIFYD